MRDLSVIIPSFNGREHLGRTIEDLLAIAPEAEVIVVDGGSRDGSPDMVRENFPSVRLLEVENHGFSHATNRGIEASSRDLVLMLNSDLFLNRPALEAMAEALRSDATIGAVGPHLFNEDGSRQHHFTWLYWPRYLPHSTGPHSVTVLCGACLMTRRDVLLEVGCLDESFFLYNEEYDWCERTRKAGYGLQMLPVGVTHVGGGSTVGSAELTHERYRGFLYVLGKHRPLLVPPIRRAMQFKGWYYKRFGRDEHWRAMWKKVEHMTERADYSESPYPLSGRGVVRLDDAGATDDDGAPFVDKAAE